MNRADRRIESVWDDISEAVKWKPILPLLKAARDAAPGPAKLAAIRDVVEFFLHTTTGAEPKAMPGFQAFNLFVEVSQSDPRVGQAVSRLMAASEIAGR